MTRMPLLRYPHRLYRLYRLYRSYRMAGIRLFPKLRPLEIPTHCLRCRTRCIPLSAGKRYCPDCMHRIEHKKRRSFQWHLSTCLLLSLLSGTLLGVNLLTDCEKSINGGVCFITMDGSSWPITNCQSVSKRLQQGWPYSYWSRSEETYIGFSCNEERPAEDRLISELEVQHGTSWDGRPIERHVFFCRCEREGYLETKLLIFNLAVCLFLLAASAIALEWAARRSDRISFVRRAPTIAR